MRALILMGSFACGAEWLARSTALGYRVHDRVLEMLEHWGEGRALDLVAPSAAGRDQARRFGTFERGGSPAAVAARWKTCARLDVAPLLDGLQAPTLVLHRRDGTVPSVLGRKLAEAIPGLATRSSPAATTFPGWATPTVTGSSLRSSAS